MKAHLLYQWNVNQGFVLPEERFIPFTDVYIPVEIRWCSINKRCPSSQRTNERTNDTLCRHNGPYSLFACHCCHDMMKPISRAIDALIQDCRIEIIVTLWDLLNTLYSSDSGFFSFIFVWFFVDSSFVNCHIWTTKNVVATILVAIAIKYFWILCFVHLF